MGFFKRHPILSAIAVFILLTIPSAIDTYWDLYQKSHGAQMPPINLGFGLWALPLIGLVLAILIMWQSHRVTKQTKLEMKIQQAKVREKYVECQEIPTLLWQLYLRAKELAVLDNKKDAITAKIPDMGKILADSGFLSPSNRSLISLQKFAQRGNPLISKVPKLTPKQEEKLKNALINVSLGIQGVLDMEGFGTLKLVQNDAEICKGLLSRINELKIGLPDKIQSAIDKHRYAGMAIANLSYFEIPTALPMQYQIVAYLFSPACDSIFSEMSSNVAKLIEIFLSGED